MKRAAAGLVFLLWTAAVFAQAPDPRDSIILESKTVAPGAYPGSSTDTAAYLYLKVYITNKDSLTAITLVLKETSTSGGAYVILGRPRNFGGMASLLTNTLRGGLIFSSARYHSNSPDTFSLAGLFDPLDASTLELPNAVRKALWEIKFDSVWNNTGTVEFDTARIIQNTVFTTTWPLDVYPNFVKGVVTVVPKGDLDLDGELTVTDVVLISNCIFETDPASSAASPCDLNCDRKRSPADVIWELWAVFLGRQFPC
ncbi:MAG TPA: hypothetical protein VI546_01515 [candidate division Zixibacteria bacterium]|nr:hypothetical protein [candidate division Zixibacteria bacterium]